MARVLFDECVPRPLRRDLPDHEVSTVAEMGWRGLVNGELLRRAAEAGFDMLFTVDANLRYQQNPVGLVLAVVVLEARSNDVNVLRPAMPRVAAALAEVRPGEVWVVRL